MSLIHTCELYGANPLDYLTALQKRGSKLLKLIAEPVEQTA